MAATRLVASSGSDVPAGKGLKTLVYMPEKQEPELMYKLFDEVVGTIDDRLAALL